MLRGIIICPDVDLNERLETILTEIGIVSITRTLERYPNALEMLRVYPRACASSDLREHGIDRQGDGDRPRSGRRTFPACRSWR
jgi:hypothetical protein